MGMTTKKMMILKQRKRKERKVPLEMGIETKNKTNLTQSRKIVIISTNKVANLATLNNKKLYNNRQQSNLEDRNKQISGIYQEIQFSNPNNCNRMKNLNNKNKWH